MQGVLQRGDEDLAAVVPGHLALLDQGDGGHQGLDGGGVLPGGSILHGAGDRGAGHSPADQRGVRDV